MSIDFRYLCFLFLNYLIDSFYAFSSGGPRSEEGRKPVLIVRLDAIGDFVLWLDSARAIREMYPVDRYKLVLLGNRQWTELAEESSYFDEVVEIDRKRLFSDQKYRCKIWSIIRRTHFYLAINPVFSRDFNIDDSVIRVSGADRRIGFVGDCTNHPAWKKKISDRWYTELIDVPVTGAQMELESNAHFIRSLGNESFRAGMPKLDLDYLMDNREKWGDYIVVVPCASEAVKQWPVAKYAELLKVISEKTSFKILICGAPGEEGAGNALKDRVTGNVKESRIEVLSGKTSLKEYIGIIKHAMLVVGNDSSAIHIAAAVGTKSVCIAGGGHFGRFVPYRLEKNSDSPLPITVSFHMDCYHCKYKACAYLQQGDAVPCLDRITVSDVLQKISDILHLSQ